MKRLLSTTAVTLLASLGAAQAGQVNIVIQDFDVQNEQNVINSIDAGAIVDSSQEGTNIANIASLLDTTPGAAGDTDDGGTAVDPLLLAAAVDAVNDVFGTSLTPADVADYINGHGDLYAGAQLFADIQRVTNTAKAGLGAAEVAQTGTNVANVFTVEDAYDGSDVGDVYLVYQSFGSWFADGYADAEVTRQTVENTIRATDDINDSSQDGTNLANVISIADDGGSLDAGELVGNQMLLVQVAGGPARLTKQLVRNKAHAGDDINGLTQSALNAVNLVSLTLDGDQASGLTAIGQKTYENFDQSISNVAQAHSIATGIAQSGTNLGNVVTVSVTVEDGNGS